MNYYKVPIVDEAFQGVEYSDILEGIAFERHVLEGYGYIRTNATYSFAEVTEEQFDTERRG